MFLVNDWPRGSQIFSNLPLMLHGECGKPWRPDTAGDRNNLVEAVIWP